MALLEADVALPVVKSFIEGVKAKALGAEVLSSLTPGQAFIGILHQELVRLMGGAGAGFRLRAQPPVVMLLAGLQGAGKTTTAAKLARWLIEQRQEARAPGEHRRAPPGRHAAAGAPGRPGGRGILPGKCQQRAGGHRRRGARRGRAAASSTS